MTETDQLLPSSLPEAVRRFERMRKIDAVLDINVGGGIEAVVNDESLGLSDEQKDFITDGFFNLLREHSLGYAQYAVLNHLREAGYEIATDRFSELFICGAYDNTDTSE